MEENEAIEDVKRRFAEIEAHTQELWDFIHHGTPLPEYELSPLAQAMLDKIVVLPDRELTPEEREQIIQDGADFLCNGFGEDDEMV